MGATFLNQKEREWISSKVTGVTAQTPLNQLKRTYYISYVGGTIPPTVSLSDLETRWLDKYIRTLSGTPSSDNNSSLWKEIVVAIGKTPSNFLNDNKIIFYSNAL